MAHHMADIHLLLLGDMTRKYADSTGTTDH